MKMQRLASFVVGLLFVMHALGQFTAHAHHGKEGLSLTGKGSFDQKELIDHEISVAEVKMIGLGGRKMAAQKVMRKLEPARPAAMNGDEATASSSTSPKNSGATRSSDGNCDFEGKGDLNVKCKLGDDHDKSNTSSTTSAKKYFKVAPHDFVAFGADYHGPAHHPPKHN